MANVTREQIEEFQSQEKVDRKDDFLHRIGTEKMAVAILGLGLLLVAYIYFQGGVDKTCYRDLVAKNETYKRDLCLIDKREKYEGIVYLGIGAFILYIITLDLTRAKLLTEAEAKLRLYTRLKYKQQHGYDARGAKEIREGIIKIDLKGNLQYYDGVPWRWYFGFRVISNDGLEHQYSAGIDPYIGDIRAIFEGYFDPGDIAGQIVPVKIYVRSQMDFQEAEKRSSGRASIRPR